MQKTAAMSPTASRTSLRPIARLLWLGCALGSLLAIPASDVAAQFEVTPEQMEQINQLPPEQRDKILSRMKGMRGPRGPAPSQPPTDEKPKEEKPKDDKAKEEKKEAPDTSVKRPTTPDFKPDPNELKAAPDKDGRVQFSFFGQPWKDVLQWYADVSGSSFDWQELPEGYLNLTTKRKHTLAETRDLLNRCLLARGFTMLSQGEVLTAVKIEKLDPSLIPRIEADDLEDYLPHDFVRVRFQLPATIEPAKAAEDAKLLLSPHAKVVPLLTTRRLLVLDVVANLRDVRDWLYAEQSAIREDERPSVYMIRYRRADYIADQVMIVLGLDPASRKTPQELQLEQQRMQLYTQMMQKGKDVSNMLRKDGPEVFVTVDKVRNAVLVNAPPEMMPTIERTIEMLDVPDDGGQVANSSGLEIRQYKTITANTDSVVTALKEIGNLHPLTQLQGDASSRTIFAYATREDHTKIQSVLDKLDSSGRGLRVVWLSRRTPADRVAGTIRALMIGDEDQQEQSSRRSRFSFYGFSGNNEPTDDSKFRIQADIENNRLLMWANDAEYDEVTSLLEKLGVISSPNSGNPSQVRVLDARTPEETARLLEQLQRAWGGKNRLEIQGPLTPPPQSPPAEKQPADEEPSAGEDKLTSRPPIPRGPGRLRVRPIQFSPPASDESSSAAPSDRSAPSAPGAAQDGPAAAEAEPPPIHVVVTPDGRILLNSEDAVALDQLEDLIVELAPRVAEFEVFQLRNARASSVSINLEEYFKEELKGQTESVFDEWGQYEGKREKKTGASSLSSRPLLRFIWDPDTNTIVVQNASPSQLVVIRKLIEIYDQDVGEDSVAKRRTEAIKVKYSRAQDIANSLKEVYRDLLSSKDKEFQGKDGQKGTTRTETHYRFFNSGDSDNTGKKSAPVKINFEGTLSVGVDEISNTVIVSAEESIWSNIRQLVEQLDEAARPGTTVKVHEVRSSVPAAQLRQALAEALGQPWPGGKPPADGGKPGGGKKADSKNGDRPNGEQAKRED
jgi:type II secretory pathway component GspD/PulD (secretin)